ncbi:MAG: hypothetical protein IKP65_05200 [Alphaproteobacteria bacterium]|nr:hypothetical protein [Alphaproteobacteria bacterium]
MTPKDLERYKKLSQVTEARGATAGEVKAAKAATQRILDKYKTQQSPSTVAGQKPGSYTNTSTVPIPKYKKMPDGSYAPVSTTRSAQQSNLPVKAETKALPAPKT